jgi:hypothetical protein
LASVAIFLFMLAKNDWSMGQLFGNPPPPQHRGDELRGLKVDQPDSPITERAKLSSGEQVLAVQGVVSNDDHLPRMYVYVRVTLKDAHGRSVTTAESPAGNIFSKEQLATMSKSQLASTINPAGRDGRNAKLVGGQTVAYMVVITNLPRDYSSSKYSVHAQVSKAELYDGP